MSIFVWRLRRACRHDDGGEAAANVLRDAIVGKAEDAQAASGKDAVSFAIVVDARFVYVAIDFNDEPGGMAIEISDKAVNDLLAAEMQARQATGAEIVPEARLGWR